MGWRISFVPAAEKEFGRLPHYIQQEIRNYLKRVLARENPRQLGKPLHGNKAGIWRYRVGKYRVLCHIRDDRMIVVVIRIATRDKVYR